MAGFLKFDYEKILNVKASEFGYVRLLFLHNFFQGIGLAMFFNAANSIFLAQASVKSLPLVYMLASLLLLLVGITYSYFEQRVTIKKLLLTILIILFISILLIRIGVGLTNSLWIAFAAIMWYRVTSLLNYLEFWGLTSMMLDVRQSKRLFGLVSSGEVTAKLLGYFSIPMLVPHIGRSNLILIASVAFAICIIVLQRIAKRYGENKLDRPKTPVLEKDKKESVLAKYFKSHFIVLLSVLSFISVIVFTFIDFSFLSNLQLKFKSGDEISVFLGWFYGFNKGVTVLIKMFLSGRIIDKIGIKNSLLLIPAIFILIIGGIISYNMMSSDTALVFTLFSLLLFVMESLRYSIFEPVFFSLFQPLNKNLRLFGHAIVNGYLNPIALGIAGLTLFLFIYIKGSIDLTLISYVLIGLLIVWIAVVLITNKQYIIVLQDAIKKRFFEGSEMHIKGKAMSRLLMEKLQSKSPEEVIYSSQLLFKTEGVEKNAIIETLLDNESEEVVLYALNYYTNDPEMTGLKAQIFSLIQDEKRSEQVKEAAIIAYCKGEDTDVSMLFSYLESGQANIRKGTIIGLLQNGSLEGVVLAGQKLLLLLQSENAKDNITALEIIGILKVKNFYQPLINMFGHKNPEIVKTAIEASGYVLNSRLLPYLAGFLSDPLYSELAAKSIAQFGNEAVEFFEKQIAENAEQESDALMMFRITQILGNIATPEALKLLLKLLDYPLAKVQNEAILNLKKAGFKAEEDDEFIRKKFDQQFEFAAWLYNSIYHLEKSEKKNPYLISALKIELKNVKENILYLLSFLYDTYTIIKAREGLLTDFSEKKANALEIIDNLISKKMYNKLTIIFEDSSLDEKIKKIQAYNLKLPSEIITIIEYILRYRETKFNRWTIVTAIISLLDFITFELTPLIIPFTESRFKLLSEAAADTIKKITSHESFKRDYLSETFENEKIHGIMEKSSGNTLLDIEKVIILKGTSLFMETPENILVDIVGIVKEEHFEEGSVIMNKGEIGTCMYIICEGEVRIHDNDLTLAVLKNKDFFGELALLDPEPRSASATALKDSLLLRLDQEAFYELMSERLEVAKGILKILCRRIRNQNQIISELKKNTLAAPAAMESGHNEN